jgi:AcrR family transcriptional regulator
MASPRRVGAETSKTRSVLLDSTERLMLDEGYAAVTYRSVAARSEVTAGLVQYYFPTLDELFIALLRRRSERNLENLLERLEVQSDQPLRVIWEYSSDETTAALLMEFMALANHRKTIRAEIAEVIERSRKVQIDAVSERWSDLGVTADDFTPAAMLFLLAGIPKMMLLEGAFGISTGHPEIVSLVEEHLDRAEPRQSPQKRSNGPRRDQE